MGVEEETKAPVGLPLEDDEDDNRDGADAEDAEDDAKDEVAAKGAG